MGTIEIMQVKIDTRDYPNLTSKQFVSFAKKVIKEELAIKQNLNEATKKISKHFEWQYD